MTFGSAAADNVQVTAGTTITCTSPAGTGTVDVLVNSTANGSAVAADAFAYVAPPVVSFAAPVSFPVGSGPGPQVEFADVNTDGKPDLVVSSFNPIYIAVLLNTTPAGSSTPSFSAATQLVQGDTHFAIGDIDGDARPDIIQFGTVPRIDAWLNRTASGATAATFTGPFTVAATGSGRPGAMADMNQDGKVDLAVTTTTRQVFLNETPLGNSTPVFGSPGSFTIPFFPQSTLTLADLNGDGAPDVIGAGNPVTSFTLQMNRTSAGALTPALDTAALLTAGDDILFITAGDVNGEIKPDLIGVDRFLNVASVLMNTTPSGGANASFAPKVDFPVGINPVAAVLADFSGDGKPDIAVTNSTSPGSVSVLVNNTATGATTPSFAPKIDVALTVSLFGLAAGDVNGDGKVDLAVIDPNAGTVLVLLNTRQ